MERKLDRSLLLQLPSEILEHIIYVASKIARNDEYQFSSWQYPEHSYTNLKHIALTCRRLYLLCTPYLWRDKEFILPAENDKPNASSRVHMATDILGEQAALFHHLCHLGCYVRSLCRDLTNSPHYDLPNSCLMARLVCSLRALRIDFHPSPRTEHYGLRYFAQHCPSLSELYLENCRDTFDDFYAFVHYQRRLRSLTLLNCTMKADTLIQLADLCRGSLQSLLLQQIWIEPIQHNSGNGSSSSSSGGGGGGEGNVIINSSSSGSNDNNNNNNNTNEQDSSVINNLTTSYLYSNASTFISAQLYTHLLDGQFNLTRLALSDSVSLDILQIIARGSPHLERLAIAVHERHPSRVAASLTAISRLKRLTLLSLAFRYVTNIIHERLACCAPAISWASLIQQLSRLQYLHVSALQLLCHGEFISGLIHPSSSLKRIMLHHLALVPTTSRDPHTMSSTMRTQQPQINGWDDNQDATSILDTYEQDLASAQNTIESWRTASPLLWNQVKGYVLSLAQAKQKGFTCFYSTDKVCFVKGFDDWTKS